MPEDKPKVSEEHAIILDYLKHGYATGKSQYPLAQALGTTHFQLLELVPKKEVFLQPLQKVYIGAGKREEIHHTKGRINMESLTTTARQELDHLLSDIVTENEQRFVDFFNKCQPLSMRMHTLELLPGLGKKHMWVILEERQIKPFESFQDIKERVKLLPDPKMSVIKRIIKELEGNEKYRIFTK